MFSLIPRRKEKRAEVLRPRTNGPFGLLREEFEPLFNRFFGEWPVAPWAETWEWPIAHGLEMEELENEYVDRAELPGFEPTEMEVRLTGNMLTVEAEHKEPEAVEKKEPKEKEEVKERRYARVERSIMLPLGTELEKLTATYRNGVLEMHVPKTPEAIGRRIEVKT